METLINGFMAASWAGRIIAIGITIASIFSWAIIFFKAKTFRRCERDIANFQQLFEHLGGNLDALYQQVINQKHSPAAKLFQACYREIHILAPRESDGAVIRAEVVEGVERASERAITEIEMSFERGLSILAMVASIAPLLGLLGTVWGILEVFQNMDKSTTATIDKIAPGISAALVTTAFGLLAAMPAAAAYNLFVVRSSRMISILENLSSMISNILVKYQLRQSRG